MHLLAPRSIYRRHPNAFLAFLLTLARAFNLFHVFTNPRHFPVAKNVILRNRWPLNHVQVPLPEVLQDICRHVDRQDRHVWFVLHEEELKAKTITFRTKRPMRLKQVLDQLTDSAGFSFRYTRCATCGAIAVPIKIFKHHRVPQPGERRLFIRHDGLSEQGDEAKETGSEADEPGQ